MSSILVRSNGLSRLNRLNLLRQRQCERAAEASSNDHVSDDGDYEGFYLFRLLHFSTLAKILKEWL